ncbi:MAG: ATP-binding protein, partial [Proteobacteria bacterium]|nr:ATP-binding protein [Pseudomonadota bacterium]
VCDAGPGIPSADRENIFLPFFRSATHGTAIAGSGLGLSLVRQIAQHHGGNVTYQEGDGGNCFVVALPIRPPGG